MIEVIGTDAGAPASLPPAQQELLRQAALVAAPRRLHAPLQSWAGVGGPALIASDQPEPLLEQLRSLDAAHPVVVLASGDPLWFGIGRLLLEGLPAEQLRFHPAPSSLQLAFARIGRPWQDASWLSLHGRDPEPLAARLQQRPGALAVLTDPSRGGAETVRRCLRAAGLEQAYAFWLCERLGHSAERVQRLEPQDPLPADLDPLHLVVLVAEPPALPAHLPLFGLPDGVFLQHPDRPGLMTKREVRIQLLADLDLPQEGVLWDIGAGVGSVGLEALRLRPALQLWALEQRGGSAALIEANAERLGVTPARVLEGRAPEALVELPDPDRVLIGGGGRDRRALLEAVLERLRPGGVVVIPLATVEALAELRPVLEQASLTVAVAQHQAWRGAPLADGTRLAPLNPVLVLRGERPAPATRA
ncbi:MAG: precorrin-6y C5,15-methyltransferase (decarboxylating) subunit CbiE [Cyanobacteria bacterium M_surface_7_m2_037]|nr:precorrin-6y C5,15-methyltransferase (decarboxylating) subunit CbiE [Cyanobacteria bacterium M_surface_7_m2_037]